MKNLTICTAVKYLHGQHPPHSPCFASLAETFKETAKVFTSVLLRSKQRILKEFVEDNYERLKTYFEGLLMSIGGPLSFLSLLGPSPRERRKESMVQALH